jgi:hypothetical protein
MYQTPPFAPRVELCLDANAAVCQASAWLGALAWVHLYKSINLSSLLPWFPILDVPHFPLISMLRIFA